MRFALEHQYIALGCAAVVLFISVQLIAFVFTTYKRRTGARRAVERLRNLPRGEPLEPQLTAEALLPAIAEIQPIREHAEPAGLPELHPSASVEVALPVSAEVEPILVSAKPLEIQPAASTEVHPPVSAEVQPAPERAEPVELPEVHLSASVEVALPVSTEVEPTLVSAKPLEIQPAASVEVHPPVSAEVQPALQRAEPPELPELHPSASVEVALPVSAEVEPTLLSAEPREIHPSASVEMPLPVSAEVETMPERAELPKVQPASPKRPQPESAKVQPMLARAELPKVQAAMPKRPLPVSARVQPMLAREKPAGPRPRANPELPMSVGSKVWAVCKFGSVTEGTPGIITGVANVRFFWQSPAYLCTFANNIKVHARPKDIEPHDHEHSLEELEQPDLNLILSRRMTLRAQQILYRQRPARLPFADRTEVPNEIAELKVRG